MTNTIKTLDGLYYAIKSGAIEFSDDLPVFGGEEPLDTQEIWSWDETRLLVGTGADDVGVVTRAEWAS